MSGGDSEQSRHRHTTSNTTSLIFRDLAPCRINQGKKTQMYYLALSPRCALYNISGFSSYRVTGSVKKEIIITSRVEEKEKESKGLRRY